MLQVEVKNLSKGYELDQQGRPAVGASTWKWLFGQQRETVDPERCFWAIKDVSFNIKPGERVGIIGPNGAGKSTLLKILSRIVYPTKGEVVIRGRVASLLELGAGFSDELSGGDNIYLNASLYGLSREEVAQRFQDIVDFSGVGKFIDVPLKHYSSGMRIRLAFAITAFIDPDILILDEVLAVGDIAFQKKCLNRVSDLTTQGRTLIFVSHSLGDIGKFCNRVIWLEGGQIRFNGDVETGIALYQSEMLGKSTGNKSDLKEFRGERKGTGLARYERVRILDENKNPIVGVRTSQNIYFELSYSLREKLGEPIREVSATASVENDKKQRLFTTPSEILVDHIGEIGTEGRLLCKVNRLPLVPGVYSLTVSFHINRQLVDKVVDALTFSVFEGDFFGTGKLPIAVTGPVCVPFNWSAEPGYKSIENPVNPP